MNLKQRIDAFSKLGVFFKQFSTYKLEKLDNSEMNTLFFESFNINKPIFKDYYSDDDCN